MDGKVKSLGADSEDGYFTSGVVLPGEYEFSTSQEEHITLTVRAGRQAFIVWNFHPLLSAGFYRRTNNRVYLYSRS